MVVQWGAAWNVQHTSIVNGNAGGDGIDATGEYNTASIDPVPRAQTWVWGTGYTNDANTGSSAEGVALTLGNGVARETTESRVAAGIDEAGNGLNFDVYAISHPQLAVDHRFQVEGNAGTGTVNVPVNTATANRMALVYNALDDQTGNYPTPLLYASYGSNTSVQVVRRSAAPAFAAWIQGIDFSQIRSYDRVCASSAATCYAPVAAPGPSNVILGTGAGANGVTIAAGATMTFTYQAVVDNPISAGIASIANTATVTSFQQPTQRSATATDVVARLSVDVEHDNAGYASPGGTYTFAHAVTNLGALDDSYDMTATSLLGWKIELLNPLTGSVIAIDATGDGSWDSGATINTGTLAPGGTRQYFLRVTALPGSLLGDEDRIRLTGTSLRNSSVSDTATDQLTVIADTNGSVQILPDNSGVVLAGGSKVYPHRIFNNTASSDTFDLAIYDEMDPSDPGWTSTLYWDANGDGSYTAGIDQAITNSQLLAPGASQLIFVKVDSPATTRRRTGGRSPTWWRSRATTSRSSARPRTPPRWSRPGRTTSRAAGPDPSSPERPPRTRGRSRAASPRPRSSTWASGPPPFLAPTACSTRPSCGSTPGPTASPTRSSRPTRTATGPGTSSSGLRRYRTARTDFPRSASPRTASWPTSCGGPSRRRRSSRAIP